MATDYLERILTASVYDVAVETPLDPMPNLTGRLQNTVLLKREDLQPVFSFKIRGAYNKMARLSPDELRQGVITASAGNHAQGVALSAQRLGCEATIVMPSTTPAIKINAVASRGARVVLHGDSFSDAYLHAVKLTETTGATYIPPFDDPDVIAGQGTIGMEILRQHTRPIHAVFVAIGGGGLAAGVAAYIKRLKPQVRVIGVQTADSDAMARSIAAGQRVELKDVGLFSDGTAVKLVGEETFRLCRELLDEVILVDTDAICAAIKDVFEDTRSILEPAGALALAGLKAYVEREQLGGQTLVAVASGANMNFDRLRHVSERSELGERREAILAVTIPEQPGSFKKFIALLGNRNITEFNYRYGDVREAHVFVGMQTEKRDVMAGILQELAVSGLHGIDLTDNELAKLHVRHLMGGHAPARNERVLRFEFPERPGALMKFLSTLHTDWNISLFHYRNHGADYGRVLVGLQVPDSDTGKFYESLDQLGYPYLDETDNPAYRLFLGALPNA
ncbi:threonine ammonia-lyase, biosynthetic [Laribacter hongkongensis]|uniref:L-threonine dehydratase n=4 Tax=Laribacter hongkongensis TaxID=168471 RepID=A0ABD4SQX5_9NEIS|nr:threonine ammonia-lyase, biosynthetic [Laribacter hongkongensis]MCG9026120.1 threonine ammonia-lyase, biosynthetic [Laribacter hongkongensis]MCG9101678.1 threonine ammonia-lyase, biosynthetic [Laribacter hongkongensis]MCG9103751.1 threonine ammonia-lyase, biosynthetic [Laribacter hongkongensis]MCG9114028.1 threonine ammonia-lyase, biosynthetic [Laribacter hongkongensis]MCG9118062.1 threonine ammonia-lyase, biosynthetic [Laribacter hongkongensis]